jgi:hypothetical protein
MNPRFLVRGAVMVVAVLLAYQQFGLVGAGIVGVIVLAAEAYWRQRATRFPPASMYVSGLRESWRMHSVRARHHVPLPPLTVQERQANQRPQAHHLERRQERRHIRSGDGQTRRS